MKKLHKILTLALALIMILGVMAVPASAISPAQRFDPDYIASLPEFDIRDGVLRV